MADGGPSRSPTRTPEPGAGGRWSRLLAPSPVTGFDGPLRRTVVITNLVGAVVVVALCFLIIPLPDVPDPGTVRLRNGGLAALYVVVAVLVGRRVGRGMLSELTPWWQSDAPADEHQRLLVVMAPLRLLRLQLVLWWAAAVLFAVVNLGSSVQLAADVALTVAITGVSTAACAYLLVERMLRPATARALQDGELVAGSRVPSVATRAVLAWALGSGGPLLGVILVGAVSALGGEATRVELHTAMVTLGGIAVAVGVLAVGLAARATADPIEAVSAALREVQDERYDVRVPIDDATQIGRLQAGFNRMADGLQERERIRRALGVYVDPDVAELIVREGAELSGEEVQVSVLFLDVRDFTGFAERHEPTEVIAAVNELFELAIPVITDHGGRIDKFVGDGLMAVFGAPQRVPRHAQAAVDAGRGVLRELRRSGSRFDIGIGINSGTVIAGNVGGSGRLEYSVMGDAVNVAARVEAATRQTGDDLLLSEHTAELLDDGVEGLRRRDGVTLKGKSARVAVYALGASGDD